MSEHDKPEGRDFDRAFGEWGRRAPRTPPETAAKRVTRLLESPRAVRRRPRLAWVAATLVVVAAGTWYVVRNGGEVRPVPPQPMIADVAPLPLDDDVVLWWLDEETPVYFVLSGPEHEERGHDDAKPR